jgi:Flp pilus assembly protein TadD
MSRNPAFLATAISALLFAGPALAWPGKAKPEASAPAPARAETAPATASASADPLLKGVPQPTPAAPQRKATPEERAQADRLDPLARAAFWSNQAGLDPRDLDADIHLASALRALGQNAEAAQAAGQALVIDPSNRDAMMEQARAYLAAGRGFYAIAPLEKLRDLDARDWRIWSLLGVAYAQVSRDQDAASALRQALVLSPDNPAVLSNQAMQAAAHGDLASAEALLRQAAADPRATVQERQNLALVLGLQGKFAEAERLVRKDLPPALAENNIAYWKAAAGGGETRSWDALRNAQAVANPSR